MALEGGYVVKDLFILFVGYILNKSAGLGSGERQAVREGAGVLSDEEILQTLVVGIETVHFGVGIGEYLESAVRIGGVQIRKGALNF